MKKYCFSVKYPIKVLRLTVTDNSIFEHITRNHPANKSSNKWRRFQKVNDAKGHQMGNVLQHMHATLEHGNQQA